MYSERASTLPHVTAWWSVTGAGPAATRILPDGCLDIIWRDGHVFVAGPDTTAQVGLPPPGSRHFALRFGSGTGPGVLGLPASALVDQQVPLDALVPTPEVRRLSSADDPLAALTSFAARRWVEPDPAMVALTVAARAGVPFRSGLSSRQLLRRSNAAFGYGAKMLHRILRMQRAVALARSGRAFASVSFEAGYADQAHLSREVKALTGVPLRALLSPS